MFKEARAFNQNINSWQTDAATKTAAFWGAGCCSFATCGSARALLCDALLKKAVADYAANETSATANCGEINTWNVTEVKTMAELFREMAEFDADIDSWQVGGVTDVHLMFSGATRFNQPLDSWQTSAVMDMSSVFHWATAFNQPLNSWQTTAATTMSTMFYYAMAFDQDIDSWQTENVANSFNMFTGSPMDAR